MYLHDALPLPISCSRAQIRISQLSDGCGGPVQPPILPGQCDATVQQQAFLLVSPGYPVRYPPSTDCTTTVLRSSPEASRQVQTIFFFFLVAPLISAHYAQFSAQRHLGSAHCAPLSERRHFCSVHYATFSEQRRL